MTIKVSCKIIRKNFSLKTDLEIPSQGITAIYGDSGSGKTTLLRCIAGIESESVGFVSFKEDVWQDGQLRVPTFKRPLGYVFQEDSLFPHLTVLQNILYGFKRTLPSRPTIKLEETLELLKIANLVAKHPSDLSGGERQRVSIARALMLSPKILLMDEPLAALDRKIKQRILNYIKELHQKLEVPILYVSHSPEEILFLAHHLIVLDNGRIIANGPIENTKCALHSGEI